MLQHETHEVASIRENLCSECVTLANDEEESEAISKDVRNVNVITELRSYILQ